uniref:ZP domain-containing protein n=1 Tax=Parastrongyloides trichosuri TaxID=131310 RepID=A0A0N4Z9L3_PARTI
MFIKLIVSKEKQSLPLKTVELNCFYPNKNGTVYTSLSLSVSNKDENVKNVSLPNCKYEILNETYTGSSLKKEELGQVFYHQWSCKSANNKDSYCMLVHNCIIFDGKGNQKEIIDDNGCSNDKNFIENLEYPSNLMVRQKSSLTKFKEKYLLTFRCQISLTFKEMNDKECEKPNCYT